MSLCRFTPSIEVDLCGHATLAAAHALFESGEVGSGSCGNELIDTIRFKSRSRGILTATRQKQNGKVSIELDFPAQLAIPSTLSPLEMSSVCTGFGIKSEDILFVGRSIDDLVIRVSPEVFYRIPTLASGQLDVVKVALMQQRKVIFTCTGPLRYVDDFCAHANAETQALMATHNHDIPTQPYPFPTDFLSRCFATRCVQHLRSDYDECITCIRPLLLYTFILWAWSIFTNNYIVTYIYGYIHKVTKYSQCLPLSRYVLL